MTSETKEMTDNEARRLINVVCSPYTTAEEYHLSMSRLVEGKRLTDEIYSLAIQQRTYRQAAQCNVAVTTDVRQLVKEWQQARSNRETEDDLANWIIGKPVGSVKQGWLHVEMNGQPVPIMECRHAEKMSFQMIDGHFRLTYDATTLAMTVDAFTY